MKANAHLGEYPLLEVPHETITNGKHVTMGKYCFIITQNHKYLEESYDGFKGKNVLIGDYIWIGDRVTILPGVKIGKHVVIGAGAMVKKNVPDYAIAAGNPAIVKKFRKKPTNHGPGETT